MSALEEIQRVLEVSSKPESPTDATTHTTKAQEDQNEPGLLVRMYTALKALFSSKQDSLEAQMERMRQAFAHQYPYPSSSSTPMQWLVETFPDYVIIEEGGEFYKCPYAEDEGGEIRFGIRTDWTPVEREQKWIEKALALKAGARHSSGDRAALKTIHDAAVELGADCPMTVLKQADGHYRWVLFSSSAYEDRDKEVVSQKAHEKDIAQLDESKEYGPLRWWHVGRPTPERAGDWTSYKAGAGLDLGMCDFAAMDDRIRVESGLFYDDGVGAAFKDQAAKLAVSQGFSHPLEEPDQEGQFKNIHTFERSLLPKGRQSNPFATVPLIQKEESMEGTKEQALTTLLGAELAGGILAKSKATQKEADELGVRFKADSKIGEWTAAELKEYITKCMEGPMSEMKALFTKADGAKPEEMEEIRKKESDALAAIDVTVKETATVLTQVAGLVNSQGDLLKGIQEWQTKAAGQMALQDSQIKELTGGLPAAVVGGQLGYDPKNDPKTVVQLKEGVGPAPDDFFSWAANGGRANSAVGGVPPTPAQAAA